MKTRIALKSSLLAGVSILLAGCVSNTVKTGSEPETFLPKPTRVLVYNFAVSPEEVKSDSSLGPELEALVKKSETPRTGQERAIGRRAADALSKHLVAEIQAMGLSALRVYDPPPNPRNTLAIKGQLVSSDAGNPSESAIIGLGLGRSDLKVFVQVYSVEYRQSKLLDEFAVDVQSGGGPGAAVGTEAFSANIASDARRAAKEIANHLKGMFVTQGWIRPQ